MRGQPGGDPVSATLDEIRAELERLSERVAALERSAADSSAAGGATAASGPQESVDEDLLLVIGAAVAAFLGEKPRIRQIRVLGGENWSQQGRATIQASHALRVARDR